MKILLKTVFIVALAAFANNMFAQQKFAHINRTELIQAMPEFKTAQQTIEAYDKELKSGAEERQVEWNKKLAEFQQNFNTMDTATRNAKEQVLVDLQRRISENAELDQQRLAEKERTLFMPILQKATDAINKVAKSGGYIYVFEATATYYIDEAQSTNILSPVKTELGIPQ